MKEGVQIHADPVVSDQSEHMCGLIWENIVLFPAKVGLTDLSATSVALISDCEDVQPVICRMTHWLFYTLPKSCAVSKINGPKLITAYL